MNEKYSRKDFTHKIFTHTDPEEWNDTEVIGSCFYNETPNTQVFPEGIRNVRFINCNLDNVIVPPECTIEGGTHKLIQVQNDLEDWYIDELGKPIEPVSKELFIKLGISILPKDIPNQKQTISAIQAKEKLISG